MPEQHMTRAMRVWVDVDLGIASIVEYLNTIPGVRTLYSCQGTIGEGGPHPYKAQVGVTWPDDETLKLLLTKFDVTLQGNYWGEVHPRPGYAYGLCPHISARLDMEGIWASK